MNTVEPAWQYIAFKPPALNERLAESSETVRLDARRNTSIGAHPKRPMVLCVSHVCTWVLYKSKFQCRIAELELHCNPVPYEWEA
jgi:hypothetical protein